MLFSFVAMAGGFVLLFRGIVVFGCTSVSLSSRLVTCYSNEFGAMSGAVAGGGLIVIGGVMFVVAMLRFATVR